MRLVLDWDGTVTATDSLWMVLEEFGDPAVFSQVEGSLVDGRLSFKEVMELEFGTVTATVGEVAAFLCREVRIRSGFAELAAAERPLVLSSGFHELIEPVLAREGIDLELRANRIDARAVGWRVLWRDPQRWPICGDLCKRRSLPSAPFAYVGDGYSDRCAAAVADRVFARNGLADWLSSEGIAFERFDDLHDVLDALRNRP